MTRLAKIGEAGAVGKWMILPLSRVITWVTPRAALSGVVFVTTAAASVYVSVIYAPGAIGFFGAGLALVMLAIAIIDWRHFIIPDWLNVAGGLLALMHAAALDPEAMLHGVAIAIAARDAACAYFSCDPFRLCAIAGTARVGLGDVKLAFVAGAWLDWTMIPIAIQLAAFAALSALYCAAIRLWSIDLCDQSNAVWSILCARDLDLLAITGELAGSILN